MYNFAILLRGIHFDPNYKSGVNFKKSHSNFVCNVLNPLLSRGSVDIYISTYHSDLLDEMLLLYNPVLHIVTDIHDYSRHECIYKGLDLILNSNSVYTHILIYRFDILLKPSFFSLPNLNLDKLNIPFFAPGLHKGTERINDAFYIFPFSFLKKIRDIFESSKLQRQSHNHFLKHFKNNGLSINFLLKKTFKSQSNLQTNPLYVNRL